MGKTGRRSAILGLWVVSACVVDFPADKLHIEGGVVDASRGDGTRPDVSSADGQVDQALDSSPTDTMSSHDTMGSDTVPADGGKDASTADAGDGSTCPSVCAKGCAGGVCRPDCSSGCSCAPDMPCEIDCENTFCGGPIDCAEASRCTVTCDSGCSEGISCGSAACTISCTGSSCKGPIDCSGSTECCLFCTPSACKGLDYSLACPSSCSDNTACRVLDSIDQCDPSPC